MYKLVVKPLNSAAFDYALDHFSRAIELLSENAWENQYRYTCDIFRDAIFVASITNGDKMEVWMNLAMGKATSLEDRVSLYEIKLDHLTENHKFPETVKLLQKVLKEIGYPIKRNPSMLGIMKEFLPVMLRLRNRHPHTLLDLSEMTNPRALAFMKLTVNASTSIFGTAPDILPIVFFRQVRLSLKYGNSRYSPFAYVSFGFALVVFLNQLARGYNFGTLALQLVDKLKADEVRNRVLVTFYAFLSGWKENLRASIDPLERAFELGQKKGDYLYMGFASYFNVGIRFFLGDNLHVLSDRMSSDNAFIYRMNHGVHLLDC